MDSVETKDILDTCPPPPQTIIWSNTFDIKKRITLVSVASA